jgi:hypothetical protein
VDLHVSIEGLDLLLILSSVYELEIFNKEKPDEFVVDDSDVRFTSTWINRYAAKCKRSVALYWGESYERFISLSEGCVVKFRADKFDTNAESVLTNIASLPWTVISLGSMHRNWYGEKIDYSSPGFANLHFGLGWGCAFKGEGHKRVVSRRYLEYGPWHVIRDEVNDITLIQFHDLNVDALTALEQAKPGHKLMGDPYEGGFIQRDYKILNDDFSGLYSPSEKMLRFIINDRSIPRAELLDACAARLWQLLGEDRPIERIGYVFVIEEEARQNLHELWLRDIECWAYIEGIETRIDQDYTPPPPQKPEWVQRLELSSAA